MTRVGIVGAGITGLSLAHHLEREGVDFAVFEADDEPGGVIRSGRVDGRLLEWGPQRLRLSEPIAGLIEDLDLEDEVVEADPDLPMYVYAGGHLRRVPFSAREFLATDLLSWRGKARVLAEPLTAPGREDETAAEVFARKFGHEAYRDLLGPLFGGIYASDPAEMPARHALSRLLKLEEREGSLLRVALDRMGESRPPAASFEDGLQRLPVALAERHADRVHLGRRVEGIGEDGDGYELRTAGGTEAFDRVVVTAPGDATADLLSGVAPDAERFRELRYNPLAVVHLHSGADARGLGYQVGLDADLHTLGVSWNASAFDRDGVYTVFLGGMYDPGILDLDDDELGEVARREFETVMDADASILSVRRLDRGFPAYDRSWDAIRGVDLPDRIDLATNYTARMGVPARVREAARLADRIASE